MKRLYWCAWILGALAFWLAIGWLGIGALVVDPYFDSQVDKVIAAVAPGAPSKEDVAVIESSRGRVFNGIGILGGVFCGFAFGVAACRFDRSSTPKGKDPVNRKQDG